jgi:hypothetical protein
MTPRARTSQGGICEGNYEVHPDKVSVAPRADVDQLMDGLRSVTQPNAGNTTVE